MDIAPIKLSTAEIRRVTVIQSAIAIFAQTGYLGTSVSAIATHAEISTAYVFKLFPSKELLFVTALERCFELILEALERGAAASTDQTPEAILHAMGRAYAQLIHNRTLLMLQVHAQSAASVPEIGDALRKGLKQSTLFIQSRSGASDEAVQRFIAYGQLCHIMVVARLDTDPSDWARIITAGFSHP